jgi:Na+(H+)/acetate symporter ActP
MQEDFMAAKTNQNYDRLARLSLVFAGISIIFPIIAASYLITANGGAGYLQSLFCGVPFSLAGLSAGIAAVVRGRVQEQPGRWMAVLGIILGSLTFVIECLMVATLILPFFLE